MKLDLSTLATEPRRLLTDVQARLVIEAIATRIAALEAERRGWLATAEQSIEIACNFRDHCYKQVHRLEATIDTLADAQRCLFYAEAVSA